jgi:perosamine synthetase
MTRIPLYKPDLEGNERKYVNQCLDSGWISSKGEFVNRFEEAFSLRLGIRHCLSVSNGTAALQTALGALEIGPGDEVIVPTLTYVASANAVKGMGATPVFVDCTPDTWQMDPEKIAPKITPRTRAIMPVHLYGGMCRMDKIMAIAKQHNLAVVEDCAEAFGSQFDGISAGALGDIGTFSFYGNKTITTGEGGMVVTNSKQLFDRAWAYKSQGVSRSKEYWHESLGFNYRMTNICAALGLAQLERCDSFLARKRQIAAWYREHFSGLPITMQAQDQRVRHSHWLVTILCPTGINVVALRELLAQAGVETRSVFHPMHTLPIYDGSSEAFPNAQEISSRGICLPSWPGLTEPQVRMIADTVKNCLLSAVPQ